MRACGRIVRARERLASVVPPGADKVWFGLVWFGFILTLKRA